MLSLFLTKITWCTIIFALNSVATFTAFLFTRKRCGSKRLPLAIVTTLSYANCFSVGLFLSVCLTGLYNSSTKKLAAVQNSLDENNPLRSYPISEAILCLGFFFLWSLECLLHSILPQDEITDRPRSKFNGIESSIQPPVLDVEVIALDENTTGDRVALLAEWDDPPARTPTRGNPNPTRCLSTPGSFLRSIFLVTAMSMHTILEAVGFGLLDTYSQVLSMAVAMGLHQLVCSTTLGLRLAQLQMTVSRYRCTVGMLLAYLSLLPLGVLIGCSIHSSQVIAAPCDQLNTTCSSPPTAVLHGSLSGQVVMGVLQNFAAATFLYVVFVEILPAEIPGRSSGSSCVSDLLSEAHRSAKQRLLCCFCGLVGFLLISGLRFIKRG